MTLKIGACQPAQRIGSNLKGSATCGRLRKRGTRRSRRTFAKMREATWRHFLEEVGKRRFKVWIGATDQKEEGVWEWSCLFRFNNWVTKGTTVLSFTTSPMSTKGDGMTSRVPFSAKLCLQHNYLFRYKRYILRVL